MVEANKELAHKAWSLLEDGHTPYTIEGMDVTSQRTAARLQAAMKGFKEGKSDEDISRRTKWKAKRIESLRAWWQEYQSIRDYNVQSWSVSEDVTEPSSHLRRLREERAFEHAQKLRQVARELEAQLHLPRPLDAGTWIPPQGERYGIRSLSTGMHSLRAGRHYIWQPQKNGPGTLSLNVEKDRYFSYLRSHLPDDSVWRSFEHWKTQGAAYLFDCSQLVQAIVSECKQRTVFQILIEDEWSQEGVYWNFPKQVYRHHASVGEGYSGIKGFEYQIKESPSRVLEEGQVLALWYASAGIACHRDENVLECWRKVHEELLNGDDFTVEAKALIAQYQICGQMTESIKEALRIEIERGMFDRGRCQSCP